jgi:long-subunit fatty acid transport protein
MKRTILLSILFIFSSMLYGQYKEDAYRLSYLGLGFGARSLAMGTAYTAIANDFSAVYWNPAGLGQVKRNEISLGLSHYLYKDENTFLDEKSSFSNSKTNLNSLGLVYPFPVQKGSMVFAIGYGRQVDYATALAFNAFNKKATTANYPDNIDIRTNVLENGGLNNWMVAGAIEAARGLFLGVSLNVISGSYSYNRDYTGSDIDNNYYFYEINRLYTIQEDISGFTGRLGLLYETKNKKGRFGINVKLPSTLSMRDDWVDTENYYDDIPDSDYVAKDVGYSEFDVTTPFVFSAGASWTFGDLLLSGDVDYTDWTQMEFKNTYSDLLQENTIIKETFEPTVNFRVGAEYEIPLSDVAVRAGFAYLPSPYSFHTSDNAQKYITAGLGWTIENSVRLDFGYAYGFWNASQQVNFDPPFYTDTNEKIKTHNLIATMVYRF